MSEKVKVPSNVARAIEKCRDYEMSDFGIISSVASGGSPKIDVSDSLRSLRSYTYQNECEKADELLDALRIVYEVEEEFKLGDWVTDPKTGRVAQIDKRGYDGEKAWVDDEEFNFFMNPRHSTDEEVAQEKKRRFWAKLDRGVDQYKTADVVSISNHKGLYEFVSWIDKKIVSITQDSANSEERIHVGHLRLITPVENRLDNAN